MSSPGQSFVKDRFAAGRSAAADGIDPEILQLAEGGGGTQTASTAPQPSGAGKPSSAGPAPEDVAPSQPGLPMGQRFSQILSGAADYAMRTVKGDVGGAFDTLKKDFIESGGFSPEMKQAFSSGSFWDQIKAQYHATLATGKLPLDAFKLALQPISAPIDAATGLGAKALYNMLPKIPAQQTPGGGTLPAYDEEQFHRALNLAVSMIGAKTPKAVAEEAAAAAPLEGGGQGPAGPSAAGANIKATGNPELSGEGLSPEAAGPPPRAFDIAGERTSPGAALKVTPALRAQATDYLAGKRADNPIQASLETLASDPDIGATLKDVARFIPKGKVKPDDIRDMNAYALNLQPDEILQRLVPEIPSDELQGAAGMLVNSAGEQLQKAAKAAMENPTPENRELAVRAYAYANQAIGRFKDAGTDLGRGLRARQATQEARDSFGQAIQQVVQDVGPENVDEAIRKIAALPDPKQVSPFVSSLRTMGGRDGLLYGWYNWLLSNPATVVKKITSDATVMGWNTAVRYAAEKFGSGDVRPGETAEMWNGYVGSFRDALSAAGKALKEGHSQFYGDYQTLDGRVIEATANHDPMPGLPENITGGAMQYLRAALPTSWIGAADDFAKVMNYRAEARALAYRDGVIKGLDGADLSDHVGQLMNNLPEHIHLQARNAALRNTFQEPLTGVAEKLQDIVDKINIPVRGTGIELPLGRVIMPFVKVPANIARMAYRNGPLAAVLPSAAVKAELAAGGATRDMAIARMGLGTGVSAVLLPFILGGKITGGGPSDPQLNRAWQAAGNKPHSVRVGDTWYGYNRVEPMGMSIAALADTIETVKFAHDEDAEQLAWSSVFGIGDAMLSKTYMQGMADFLNALHDPHGEGAYYGDKLVSSMTMPQGGAALASAMDPWMRQHYGLISAVQARTPGLASNLPPVRDLWGQPVPHDKAFLPAVGDTTMAKLLSPVDARPADNAQPIDKWIWANRTAFPDEGNGRLGLTRPGQVQSFDTGQVSAQIKLSEKQLDRLRELTGNGLKDPATGLGARDTLNALVNGDYPQGATQNQWDKASPAARAVMVLRIFNRFREGAKRQLLSENPDMQASLGEKSQSRIEALRAPSLESSP